MNIKKLLIMHEEKILVDIAFEIKHSLALVGESGSGKSLTLKAILGMLPANISLEKKIESSFSLEIGKSVALIPQNPFTALSPLTKIKKQFFVEQSRVKELFQELGLTEELLECFAPELSGGELQRVVIAMALSLKPKLLLLDEPTTALDPKRRELIISLLKSLQKKEAFLILFVTHDMVAAECLCQELCILKEGKIVERGKMQSVVQNPQEEYTKTLLQANFANRNFRE